MLYITKRLWVWLPNFVSVYQKAFRSAVRQVTSSDARGSSGTCFRRWREKLGTLSINKVGGKVQRLRDKLELPI